MPEGICHFCAHRKPLIKSHVWPKFAYKRYAANQDKGGSFVDLTKERCSNKQYKEFWFCADCDNGILGKDEDYARNFCTELERRPAAPHHYDFRLLRFITSISWRTTKLYVPALPPRLARKTSDACCRWREFLLDKRRSVRPHTQHLFVIFGMTVELHRGLGGQLFLDQNLVLSQIGPLFIVGLFSRRGIDPAMLKIWDRTEIHANGGTVQPIDSWRIGGNITPQFAQLLKRHERNVVRMAWRVGDALDSSNGTGA